MNRNRRRRVTCETDLFSGTQQDAGGIFGSKVMPKLQFKEEVDYKMEENNLISPESSYVTLETQDKEKQLNGAFKKKRKQAIEDSGSFEEKGNYIECE